MRIQLYLAVLSTAFEVLLGLQAIIISHNTCQARGGGVFFLERIIKNIFQMYLMSVFLLSPGAHGDSLDSEYSPAGSRKACKRPQEGNPFQGKESTEMKRKGKEQHACAGSY